MKELLLIFGATNNGTHVNMVSEFEINPMLLDFQPLPP